MKNNNKTQKIAMAAVITKAVITTAIIPTQMKQRWHTDLTITTITATLRATRNKNSCNNIDITTATKKTTAIFPL